MRLGDKLIEHYTPHLVRWTTAPGNECRMIKVFIIRKLILDGASVPVWEYKNEEEPTRKAVTAIPDDCDGEGGSYFVGWKTKALCAESQRTMWFDTVNALQRQIDELEKEQEQARNDSYQWGVLLKKEELDERTSHHK